MAHPPNPPVEITPRLISNLRKRYRDHTWPDPSVCSAVSDYSATNAALYYESQDGVNRLSFLTGEVTSFEGYMIERRSDYTLIMSRDCYRVVCHETDEVKISQEAPPKQMTNLNRVRNLNMEYLVTSSKLYRLFPLEEVPCDPIIGCHPRMTHVVTQRDNQIHVRDIHNPNLILIEVKCLLDNKYHFESLSGPSGQLCLTLSYLRYDLERDRTYHRQMMYRQGIQDVPEIRDVDHRVLTHDHGTGLTIGNQVQHRGHTVFEYEKGRYVACTDLVLDGQCLFYDGARRVRVRLLLEMVRLRKALYGYLPDCLSGLIQEYCIGFAGSGKYDDLLLTLQHHLIRQEMEREESLALDLAHVAQERIEQCRKRKALYELPRQTKHFSNPS